MALHHQFFAAQTKRVVDDTKMKGNTTVVDNTKVVEGTHQAGNRVLPVYMTGRDQFPKSIKSTFPPLIL